MYGKIYFSGRIQGRDTVIKRHSDIFDGRENQTLYVRFNPYGGDSLTYGKLFGGHSMNVIVDYYVRNAGFSAWMHDSEFQEEFGTILSKAIDEFKKDVDEDFSLNGWIGKLIIKPIENFFDWLKK